MASSIRELPAIFNSAVFVLFGGILTKVIVLGEKVLLGRNFTVAEFGELNLAIAVLTLGMIVSSMGLTQGVPRYIPRSSGQREDRGIWLTGFLIAGVASILLCGLLIASREILIEALFDGEITSMILAGFVLCIPLLTLLKISVATIRGKEETRYKVYAEDVFYPVTRLLLIGSLIYVGFELRSVWMGYLTALILAVIASHVLLHRVLSLRGEFNLVPRQLLAFSTPLMVSAIISTLVTKIDTFMLGIFAGSYQVGLYTASYPLAAGSLIILSSFGFIYLPIVSRLDDNDRGEDIDVIYQVTSKWAYVLTFPLFTMLFAFSTDILGLLYGASYREGGTTLAVLSVGFMIHVAAGRNRETLSALGFPRFVLLSNLAVLILNVGLNVILIPKYGHEGAAIASLLSFALMTLMVYYLMYDILDIVPFSRWTLRTFLGVPLCVLPLALLASELVTLTIWALAPLAVIATVATLVSVFAVGGVQTEDTAIIDAIEHRTDFDLERVRSVIEARS